MKTKSIILFLFILILPLRLMADPCDEVWVSKSGPDLKALEKCRQLAETGDAYYQLQYGLWLFGRLPEEYQDRPLGIMWIRKSAEKGNYMAQVAMAMHLSDRGYGKEIVNYTEAYAWYAVLNDDAAMKNIADMKLTASEVERAQKLAKEYVEKYRKASTRDETLSNLRGALDRVREADNNAHVVAALRDPSPLIGLSRAQISAALGSAKKCDTEYMWAPCEAKGNWFYSFYRLPPNWVGGGPELLLQFGPDDVCTSARWVLTQ